MYFLLKITKKELAFVNSPENRCEEPRLDAWRPGGRLSGWREEIDGKVKHEPRVSGVDSG